MSEIGAMVIKLQAQTAEFRDDMGKVKADLDGLKGSAGKAGEAMDHSMTDSRESVMLLGEEVGVHMPRALSMFVSKLPGVGAAMEMAFPIIGIVAVIGIIGKLIEAHEKAKQAMAALPDQELKIGTAFAESMNKWKSKSDEAAAKIDELKGDHLGALQLRLKALNEQNLNELVGQFSKLDTVAQKVFLTLKAGMLEFGHGSEGAKDALGEFTTKYENLMALGKTDQAESLLAGTLADAKKYLAIQEQLRSHPAAYNEDAVAFARLNKVAVDSSDARSARRAGCGSHTRPSARRACADMRRAARVERQHVTSPPNPPVRLGQKPLRRAQAHAPSKHARLQRRNICGLWAWWPRFPDLTRPHEVNYGKDPAAKPGSSYATSHRSCRALVDGKENYLTIGAYGVMSIQPTVVYISSMKSHYTNAGIRKTGLFQYQCAFRSLIKETDYCGLVSGRDTDKSVSFPHSTGGKTCPDDPRMPGKRIVQSGKNRKTSQQRCFYRRRHRILRGHGLPKG